MLSLILILMESSRVVSLRAYYTDISYLSIDSLFGSYCNELWEDYGLLGINTSDIDVDATLSKYITDNITSSTLIDLFDTNFK